MLAYVTNHLGTLMLVPRFLLTAKNIPLLAWFTMVNLAMLHQTLGVYVESQNREPGTRPLCWEAWLLL